MRATGPLVAALLWTGCSADAAHRAEAQEPAAVAPGVEARVTDDRTVKVTDRILVQRSHPGQ